MKRILGVWLIAFGLFSCNGDLKESVERQHSDNVNVGSRKVEGEVAGSSYLERATEYFVLNKSDTSDFRPVFKEYKENGHVSLFLNIPYAKSNTTHRQRLEELKLILPVAASDYNLDSLSSFLVGRLVQTGDLAIEVTKAYKEEFPTVEAVKNYQETSAFLTQSKLAADINDLLEPYNLKVESVGIEKLFFASKEELLMYSAIETDTADIPEWILDCIVGIKISRIK
ncbi:hypothetical protein RCC89_00805 [Cytophagaceae bacterium ABcell3]|nr:hypothetical protein RCC89_00805 [Cytophagaceae bacterium ABcell3]